jgi:hypothetical protein
MEIKVLIISALWVNCEVFPHEWEPYFPPDDPALDGGGRFYIGYVESLKEAFGMVISGIMQWDNELIVTRSSLNPDEYSFSSGNDVLAKVEVIKPKLS